MSHYPQKGSTVFEYALAGLAFGLGVFVARVLLALGLILIVGAIGALASTSSKS